MDFGLDQVTKTYKSLRSAYASELLLEQNNNQFTNSCQKMLFHWKSYFNNTIIQSLMYFNGNLDNLDKSWYRTINPTLQLRKPKCIVQNNGDGTFTELDIWSR